jgi:post-segregation antitoxin (ccd killing protein)
MTGESGKGDMLAAYHACELGEARVVLPVYSSAGVPMRIPLYDHTAKRKTVSVTLNADLVARSVAHGINISRVAEAALIAAFETAEKAKIREELKEDALWVARFVAEHGYPFPESMAMFMPDEEDDDAA